MEETKDKTWLDTTDVQNPQDEKSEEKQTEEKTPEPEPEETEGVDKTADIPKGKESKYGL